MSMKRALFLFLGIMCVLNVSFALDKSREFSFDGDKYYLAFSNKDPSEAYVNEYIREGETLQNWKKLIGVYYFPTLADVQTAVQKLSEVVKRTDPGTDVHVIDTKKPDEAMIEFFLKSRADPLIEEYDIFRYVKSPDGKGLLTYQFALRSYGKEAMENFRKNTADRQKWIQQVMDSNFPGLVKSLYDVEK